VDEVLPEAPSSLRGGVENCSEKGPSLTCALVKDTRRSFSLTCTSS